MERIVDYAGLFPPATLPLAEALRNYAEYRRGPRSWVLGRFICPATRLAEIEAHASLLADGEPWSFSVLGRGGADADAFIGGLIEDLSLVAGFLDGHGDRVGVDALEVRMPPPSTWGAGHRDVLNLLTRTAEAIERGSRQAVCPFLEVPLEPPASNGSPGAWAGDSADTPVDRILPAIAEHNRRWRGLQCGPLGAKVRTGGVTADQFPSIDQVAHWITRCVGEGVVFKATAGLHHPFRRYCDQVGTRMHGFVNLIMASALAGRARPDGTDRDGASRDGGDRGDDDSSTARGLPEGMVQAVLADELPASFSLDGQSLGWRQFRVAIEDLRAARRERAIAFGSCSFTEPIEDLEAAGWL